MSKDLLSNGDTSLAQSNASPWMPGGKVGTRLHRTSLSTLSISRNASPHIPSSASSPAKTITAEKKGNKKSSSTPAGPVKLTRDLSLLRSVGKRSARCLVLLKPQPPSSAQIQPETVSTLPSTRQQQTQTATSTSSERTGPGITKPQSTCSPATESAVSTASDLRLSSARPKGGLVEDEMPFPSLPSTSRVRNRCSQAFSIRSSTAPVTPTTPTDSSTQGSSSSQTPATSRSATFPCSSASTSSSTAPSTPDTTSSSPAAASPPSSTFRSNSSSSFRMLFRRHKTMPVTYKGLKISAPFPKQETDQTGASSVLETDKSIDLGSGNNPAYEGLRAATTPTPVHHQPKQRDRINLRGESSAFTSGSMASVHGRSALGRSSKWSLSRLESVQSKPATLSLPIIPAIDASRSIQPPSQAAMGESKRSTKASTISFAQATPPPHLPEIKQPGQSWSSKLLTRTRSTLNLNNATGTTSKKVARAPPRPDRPAESIGRLRNSVQSSALTDFGLEGGSARIDSNGWQNIKPLPSRNGMDSGEIHASHRRESVVSGSWYSADWEDDQSLHAPSSTTRASARINKHCEAARDVNKTGKTPIGPPTISSPISTAARHSKRDAKSRLTAVTEEESEPDYDKPLPAPPSSSDESKPEASAPARKKNSHPILLQSEYKPWWEEQEIKESDFCLEVNETQHSSLEVQAPSTERSQASTMKDDEAESGSTGSPEKSMLLTEIARSYVDEQRRAEDRERQERYRKEMRGKRLGLQMLPKSPISEGESRVRSGDGQRKWRFSVFENEIESRPSTAGNSSDDSLGKLETPKDMKIVTTSVSAAASALTLPESEKVKMRPPPLKINTKKANQTPMPKLRPTNTSSEDTPRFNEVKHPSALPTPLRTHHPKQKSQAEASATRKAVMRLSDGTPVRSPCLIRRNGEVLLPPKEDNASLPRTSSFSPVSPNSSSTSSKTWSPDEASFETVKQPDTPPTADFVGYEHKDSTIRKKGDDGSDILDFYLDQYDADVAPAVPEKSPRRSLTTTDAAATKNADGVKKDRTSTYTASSNPFRDQSDDEDEDDERKQWEKEERHKRVAAILERLRAKD